MSQFEIRARKKLSLQDLHKDGRKEERRTEGREDGKKAGGRKDGRKEEGRKDPRKKGGWKEGPEEGRPTYRLLNYRVLQPEHRLL